MATEHVIPPRKEWVPYIFYKMFEAQPYCFVIDLPANAVLQDFADCNPGLYRVDDAVTGRTLWRAELTVITNPEKDAA